MQVTPLPDAVSFLAAAAPVLERDTAANNLPLGIAQQLVDRPDTYPEAFFWVAAESGRHYTEDDLAFELLSDGVAGLGYLLKERVSQVDELVRALQDVCRGGSALDPKIVEGLMFRRSREAKSPLHHLTEREREVLAEMAAGRNNAAIAKALYMRDRAVEKHIGVVFQKLGLVEEGEVNRRVMAVLAFLDAGGSGQRR